jgi:hypothetical protein
MGHSVQISSLLTTFLNLPDSQSEHLVLRCLEVRPRAHWSHSNDSSLAAVVSMPQSSHAALLLEPLFEFFFPAAHLMHLSGLVKPVADEYRPCGHPMQTVLEVAPLSAEYNPAGQTVVFLNKKKVDRKRRRKKRIRRKKKG